MWVKETYIKLVKDKTAYLAIRKAVQSRQGRQPTKDAITAQCDRLLNGKRTNSYDEYLELVEKLIKRFSRRTWAEKAFDVFMLCPIALDSLNRSLTHNMTSVIDAHMGRLGIESTNCRHQAQALLMLIATELNYIKEEDKSDQKQSVVDELYGKFMNEDKGARTVVEVFYECNSRQDFTEQVSRRGLKKYKESINLSDLNDLVEKLRKYCISQSEPSRDNPELVHDAMDLLMNDTPTRNNLLRLCRKHHERRLSSKYLFNSVKNALGIINFAARDTVIHCVVRRLLAHSKRSGRGKRLPPNRSSAIELGTRMHETAMDILRGREFTDGQKEHLRNREQTKQENYGIAYGANPNLIKMDLAALEARLSIAPMLKMDLDQIKIFTLT